MAETTPLKTNFRAYAALGLIMALLCLVFAGITFAAAAVTPNGFEPICLVGASGMSPHVEVALIESGVYKPSPKIVWNIGHKVNNTEVIFDTKQSPWGNLFSVDWLWVSFRVWWT